MANDFVFFFFSFLINKILEHSRNESETKPKGESDKKRVKKFSIQIIYYTFQNQEGTENE